MLYEKLIPKQKLSDKNDTVLQLLQISFLSNFIGDN